MACPNALPRGQDAPQSNAIPNSFRWALGDFCAELEVIVMNFIIVAAARQWV
jgi:hypothetical protein